ncbi:hypothetical protein B9Z65_6049 [Elsinoe australis]|uniref:Uncharacterized protein n=1 Tax=Elsinoe australis TaxID=40998 RepID=A0A2P7YRB1_9PEZI|nr:hypothetical protein B9Z65_6049 [Elsinoe australis]
MANAVPRTGNLRGWINLVPLGTVVAGVRRALDEEAGGEGVRFRHEIGDVDVGLGGVGEYIEGETGREVRVLKMEEWTGLVRELGMDSLLVEFFGNVAKSPEVLWQRLRMGEI